MWVLSVAFAGWIFCTGVVEDFTPRIYIGLELPLLGPPRALFSVGELGRAILLMHETFGGLFLSLLTVLMAMGSFVPELGHRDVFWACYNGARLRFALAKLVAVSSFTLFSLALGVCTALFNPTMRETMSLAGWQYVPAYLALTLIRILLWVALAMLLFSLTGSRWATVFVVFALHMAWFGTAGIWWEPSLPRLLQRNFITWNFVSAFAPFGIIPVAFFFQGLMVVGIVLTLVGAAIWMRRRFPEWVGLQLLTTKVAVGGGVILALGAGWWIMQAIQGETAPFTATELWDGKATLNRPYIWSRDYRLLVYPGKYMAVLLPPDAPIPSWVERLAMEGKLRRHDNVKKIILDGHLGEERTTASASLVLLYHSPDSYPLELGKSISRYWQVVSPLVNQAQPLLRTILRIVVIWPEDAFPYWSPIINGSEFRIGYASLAGSIKAQQRGAVRALAEALSRNKLVQIYITAYLMASIDRKEVERGLDWLRNRAEGKTPKLEVLGGIGLHPRSWKPEDAAQVLQHWERGEEMGHENYIRTLLEGKDD